MFLLHATNVCLKILCHSCKAISKQNRLSPTIKKWKNSETDFKEKNNNKKNYHFMPSPVIVGQSQDGKSEGREKTH